MTLLLFDIDGTLVLTGGAGLRSLERAFETIFARAGVFDEAGLPGRTDRFIVADVLSRLNLEMDAVTHDAFRDRYRRCLEEEIRLPHPDKRVLPGVPALLEVIASRPDVQPALLTGNFASAARIKLEHFGLWRHFPFGAFGDDAVDRNDLIAIAYARARAHGLGTVGGADTVVVGDTPLDVACARAGGATSVAVATGRFDVATLRAAGADVVMEDLRDPSPLLELLE